MAVRTTSLAVQGICQVKSSIDLTPYIEAANALVTENCSEDDYDSTRLELIERWLSAHFYKMRELQVQSEKAGAVARGFSNVFSLGFDNSTFGQMAMRLDTKGGLARLNEQIKKGGGAVIDFSWLGYELDEYPTNFDI